MPAISLNMLETYTLMAIGEEIVPRAISSVTAISRPMPVTCLPATRF